MTPCSWGVEGGTNSSSLCRKNSDLRRRGSAFNTRQRSRKRFIINDEFVGFSSWGRMKFSVCHIGACGLTA